MAKLTNSSKATIGITSGVVFIKKKRQIKKAQTADINTEAK